MADLPNSMDPKECVGGGHQKTQWAMSIGFEEFDPFLVFLNAETRFDRVKVGGDFRSG